MMSLCVAGLSVLLFAAASASDPVDYVYQEKGQCYFRNGTEDIRALHRFIFNQVENMYFDSDVGHFMANTEFGRINAEIWNNNPDFLAQERAAVETVCKHNYEMVKPFTIDKRSEPRVKITYTPAATPEYEHMLTCFVDNFFPSIINVTWLRNGVEELEQVTSSEILDDGDWTYQIHVLLETPIQRGDTFTCRVEHSSLTKPVEIDWQFDTPESARNKTLTGIVGFVIGAVSFIAGLIVYLRSKKGVRFLAVQQNNPIS